MPSHLIKCGILGSKAILVQTLGGNATRIVNCGQCPQPCHLCQNSKSGIVMAWMETFGVEAV